MTHYLAEVADAYQESWDRQQEAYLPDREHRIATMLDAVEAVTPDGRPRILDLAGGTGSISLRALARFPGAQVTVVDQDPVLLALAEASLHGGGGAAGRDAFSPVKGGGGVVGQDAFSPVKGGGGVVGRGDAWIVSADLGQPSWTEALPHRGYDAVLTATALHWLAPERLAVLYGEIRQVLRAGGVFANADHMPDEGLPELTKQLLGRADARREARYAAGAALSWRDWWTHVAADPRLAPLHAEREKIYPAEHGSAEWTPPAGWHLAALRTAGFAETGLLWRGGADATVAAVA